MSEEEVAELVRTILEGAADSLAIDGTIDARTIASRLISAGYKKV